MTSGYAVDQDHNGVLKRKDIFADTIKTTDGTVTNLTVTNQTVTTQKMTDLTVTNIKATNETVTDLFITVTGSSAVRVTGALAAGPGTTLVAVAAGSDIINSVIKITVGGTVCYLWGYRGAPTGMGM